MSDRLMGEAVQRTFVMPGWVLYSVDLAPFYDFVRYTRAIDHMVWELFWALVAGEPWE